MTFANPEFAAVHVIASEKFPHDDRARNHIDAAAETVDFRPILTEPTFSTSERLLLEIAASLWHRSGHLTSFGVLASTLGDPPLAIVLRALAAFRGRPLPAI